MTAPRSDQTEVSILDEEAFEQLRNQLAETLALAFAADPGIRHIFATQNPPHRSLVKLYRVLLHATFRSGFIVASDDGMLAALWRKPGRIHDSLAETICSAPAYLDALGMSVLRASRMERSILAHHPDEPYVYLHVLGVHPRAQGCGLARRGVEIGKGVAHDLSVPVFLETSLSANLGLYQALGFRMMSDWHVPDGGPLFHGMVSSKP